MWLWLVIGWRRSELDSLFWNIDWLLRAYTRCKRDSLADPMCSIYLGPSLCFPVARSFEAAPQHFPSSALQRLFCRWSLIPCHLHLPTEDLDTGQHGILVGRGYQDDFVASCPGNRNHTPTGFASETSPQRSVPHGAIAGNFLTQSKPRAKH